MPSRGPVLDGGGSHDELIFADLVLEGIENNESPPETLLCRFGEVCNPDQTTFSKICPEPQRLGGQ